MAGSPFDTVDFESWLAGSTESARVAVPLILEAVPARSVVDVGCGLGAWLAVFEENGVGDILGYDGPWVDRTKLLVAPAAFQVANLEQPLDAGRRFDLALCLEVAQLLEERHGAQLVESLTSLSDIVIFSAAIPGQGGIHHVNPQWPRYWAGLFGAHGYLAADPFRAALWERDDVKWWFAQNTVCFATPETLSRLPALVGSRCDAPLPLVHPGCLESCVEALEVAQAAPAGGGRWWHRRS